MAKKHRRTLSAVFANPIRSNINWSDVEAMFVAHGAEVSEGEGSRVRIALNGIRAVFHRPHPRKEISKRGRAVAASLPHGSRSQAMMEYKGYVGKVEYDDEAGVFHGEVVNTRDVITFEGATVAQLRKAFRDSVKDYIAFCAARGESPEKPYSGQFVTRINPDLHRQINRAAASSGKSLNAWVTEQLERSVEQSSVRKASSKRR